MLEGAVTDSNESLQMQAVLAEYSALRQEIVQRIGSRIQLLAASSTISAIIIGVGLERRSAELMLVVPMVACLFGLQVLYETLVVFQIGGYIRDNIEAPLRAAYNASTGWEAQQPSRRIWRSPLGNLPALLATLLPSTVTLILGWSYSGSLLIKAILSVVDLLIVAYYLVEFQRQLRRGAELAKTHGL
jgi:hypothetical protein